MIFGVNKASVAPNFHRTLQLCQAVSFHNCCIITHLHAALEQGKWDKPGTLEMKFKIFIKGGGGEVCVKVDNAAVKFKHYVHH